MPEVKEIQMFKSKRGNFLWIKEVLVYSLVWWCL
jgi:hypothetical protein